MDTSLPTYHFREFTLDLARGCVLKGGEEIKLRPKVYEALKYLVKNPGRLIGKQELIQAVWPDSFVTDDSLVQCTLELRRALDDRDQQLLKTVPRRGYLFTAEVTESTVKAFYGGEAPKSQGRKSGTANVGKKIIDIPLCRTPLIGRQRELLEAAKFLRNPDVRLQL